MFGDVYRNKKGEDLPLLEETLRNDGSTKFHYDLPEVGANTLCKQIYKNDIVKLTLQISESEALQLKRDLRVTFTDQLGVIGETITLPVLVVKS